MNETIPDSFDGDRVDRVVATLTGMTRAAVADAVKAGAVQLDGKPVKVRSQTVVAGQRVSIDEVAAAEVRPEPQEGIAFRVVYEDEYLAVIDKPEGLVVHPGAGHKDGTLVNGLLARYEDLNTNRPGQPERPGIVHRLDAGTTGLLVVARDETTHAALVQALKDRSIERRYLALAWGDVTPDVGMIDAPIGRGEKRRTLMAVSVRGKEARTSYEVLARHDQPNVSLLAAKLETGRTHQVRVHFAALGHPLVGDRRYNGLRESVKLGRPFLHARSIAFKHPRTGEDLSFSSPLPDDLKAVLAKLEMTVEKGR